MTEITDRLTTVLADRYKIERELGAGGMATVYLAHDVKHNRKVALKVLRPELAAVIGAERFLKEIEVTANLQHPHILPLHDSGEADGFLFYVMPYIAGETLRDLIDRKKQLGIEEAVELARGVAAALDYAHRQKVIHRDIKPENILLHDGQPVVADFGIALAVSHAGGTRLTETGLSIGTPHYMSPEQAMGDRELDARSDVYSLAAVLYEMLTGEPPYTGTTAQAIVARVITEDPRPLTLQRRTVPAHVAASVHQALNKLPADRFATAAEFADALKNPAFTAAATASAPGARRSRPAVRWLWPAVAVAAGIAALFGWLRPSAEPAPVMRQGIVLGSVGAAPFSVLGGTAIAPDGAAIVFTDSSMGGPQLWIKERDQRDPSPIPGATGVNGGITFSPDGEWIAYSVNGQLRKIPRRGGAPVTLSDSASSRPAWLDDGTIVFGSQNGVTLFRVSSAGGPTERLLGAEDLGRAIVQVYPLPDARGVLMVGIAPTLDVNDLMVLDLRSGEHETLVAGAGWGAYAPTGHLVYALRNGGLWAAPFDLDGFRVGQAVPLEDGIRTIIGMAEATLGPDGTLLYVRGQGTASQARLEWVDRRGNGTEVDPGFALRGVPFTGGIRLSPDGNRVAINYPGEGDAGTLGLGGDIYVKRLPTGPAARITFEGVSNRRAAWSPDGTRLVFISDRGGAGDDVWMKRADGGGTATLLVDRERQIFEAEWTQDGQWLIYRTDDDQGGAGLGDILGLRTDGDTTPVPLVATAAEETGPSVSWDSRWLAYASDETGRKEIYVRPFPNTEDGKWLISTTGGSEPAWARSGRELFYRDATGNMVAATVAANENGFEVLDRQVLFNAQMYLGNDDHRFYDVSADGERFIMISFGAGGTAGDLIMVSNFHEVLRGIGR